MLYRQTITLLFALWALPLTAQSVFDSLRLVQRTEVYFATGKHELTAETLLLLDSIAIQWKSHQQEGFLQITAHTDSVGSFEHNQTLSERRARAVQAALVQRHVPADKIALSFFGERRPAQGNSTEAGRQRNRRATLELRKAIPMAPYGGQVKDLKTGSGVQATVHFSTKTLRDSVQTDTSGHFSVRLPQDSVVKVEAYARGYFFASAIQRMIGTPEMLRRMRERPVELQLAPAQAGDKAILNNLFFVGNEAILLKSSEPELPKVLKFMQINPTIEIEIAGHINHPDVAPDNLEKWEWKLSTDRAKLVYNYLLKNRIPGSRMTYKGYGNTEMLFPHQGATEAQQEQNRRVEIRVRKG